jgi:hypothetical protein
MANPNCIKIIRQLVAIKKDHYTKKGENHDVIQMKAFIFSCIWKDLKESRNVSLPEWGSRLDNQTFRIAWEQIDKFLIKNRERILLLKKLEDDGVDLMFCTDVEIRNALVRIEETLIEGHNEKNKIYGIKTKNTKNKCSKIRSAFKVIGREHAWADGVEFKNLGTPLVFSGNPMTLSVQQHLENATKNRRKDFEEKIRAERPDGVRIKDNLDQREGSAANVGVAYFALMNSLLQTIKWCLSPSIKNIKRVENMAGLSIILAFVLHEGSRPKEIFKHLLHNRLYFPVGTKNCTKVYWLTLVFCKTETLTYILENELLKEYVIGLWKGKSAQYNLSRRKSAIPFPYNSLDLVTIYVIVLRLLYRKKPDLLQLKVVPKEKKSWSCNLQRLLAKFMIFGFTFYAIRYSAAEEDVKYGVDPDITRKRMGHTDVSQIYKQYAENLMARAALNGQPLVLGSDVIKNNPSELIPLEFDVLKGSVKINKTFEDKIKNKVVREDFCETAKLVSDYLENNDVEAFNELRNRAGKLSRKEMETEIGKIPFGINFDFPNELIPEKMRENILEVRSELAGFLNCRSNDSSKLLLWSYTQIMYGNWAHIKRGEDLERKPKSIVLMPIAEKGEDKVGEDEYEEDEYEETDSLDFEDIADIVDEIGKGNYICVYTNKKDHDSMVIPSLNKNVWLIEVTNISKKKVKLNNGDYGLSISGYRFINKEQDISLPFKKTNKIITIIVTNDSLLKIYSDIYDSKGNIDFGKEDVIKLERIFLETSWRK